MPMWTEHRDEGVMGHSLARQQRPAYRLQEGRYVALAA
jgi:hypothetical protein